MRRFDSKLQAASHQDNIGCLILTLGHDFDRRIVCVDFDWPRI
ncbi:hypothetical protein DSUL_100220 [Desulfovibrionales bacterium]